LKIRRTWRRSGYAKMYTISQQQKEHQDNHLLSERPQNGDNLRIPFNYGGRFFIEAEKRRVLKSPTLRVLHAREVSLKKSRSVKIPTSFSSSTTSNAPMFCSFIVLAASVASAFSEVVINFLVPICNAGVWRT